ncbi:MAG: hemerythrin family protein [Melioribacteraceae bacterium]|nr:hemerythrin family protein [Melioribacteraceae bacterium]
METIVWQETYSLGIKLIDNQHRELVEIINDVYDAKLRGSKNGEIKNSIIKLAEYTHKHFDTEEELSFKYDYPELDSQIDENNQVRIQVDKLLHQAKSGNLELSDNVIDFLRDWTLNHITNTDKIYCEFLSGKEVDN